MQNKLQEMTDKLYNEGLSKGKQEGEEILARSRKEAEEIIAQAQKQAEEILAQAQKQAEDLSTKVNSDLKMAAQQSIAATKQDIENVIVAKMTDCEVAKALTSAEFVKQIILAVAEGFKSDAPVEMEVVLPESLRKEMEPFIKKELATVLKGGVDAQFSKKVAGGFTIGPKGEGWFVSFKDDTFKALISEYLRPATKKILFG